MNVTLREITKDNFETIIGLEVRKDQDHVAPNVTSIAESKIYPEDVPMAIYNNETAVGFVLYTLDYDDKCLWISRFMIDKDYQGKGFGTAALRLIKEIALKDQQIIKLGLSTHLSNIEGIKFYTNFGFVDMNRTNNNPHNLEEIFELQLR